MYIIVLTTKFTFKSSSSGGGFNVMFFGSFSKNAFGQLAQIEGKINAEKYIEMVKEYIEPELEASEVPPHDLYAGQCPLS